MRTRVVALFITMSIAMLSVGSCFAESPAYSVGSKSEVVREVQQRLIDLDLLEGKADGIFGKKTEQAVIAFQTANQLKPTGVVDSRTLGFLLPPEPTISILEQFYLDVDMDAAMDDSIRLAEKNGLLSKTFDTDGEKCLRVAVAQDDLALGNRADLVRIYYTNGVCSTLEYYNSTTHQTAFEYHAGIYWLLNDKSEPGLYLTTHKDAPVSISSQSRNDQIEQIHQDSLFVLSMRAK